MRARQFWNIKNWHWVSSAICLVGMLLFSVTGILRSEPVFYNLFDKQIGVEEYGYIEDGRRSVGFSWLDFLIDARTSILEY